MLNPYQERQKKKNLGKKGDKKIQTLKVEEKNYSPLPKPLLPILNKELLLSNAKININSKLSPESGFKLINSPYQTNPRNSLTNLIEKRNYNDTFMDFEETSKGLKKNFFENKESSPNSKNKNLSNNIGKGIFISQTFNKLENKNSAKYFQIAPKINMDSKTLSNCQKLESDVSMIHSNGSRIIIEMVPK